MTQLCGSSIKKGAAIGILLLMTLWFFTEPSYAQIRSRGDTFTLVDPEDRSVGKERTRWEQLILKGDTSYQVGDYHGALEQYELAKGDVAGAIEVAKRKAGGTTSITIRYGPLTPANRHLVDIRLYGKCLLMKPVE